MRILITGVSGFLGRHLAPALMSDGHGVFGLGLMDGVCTDGVVEECVDILDRDALVAAVDRLAPDCIVHLAGLSHVGQSWSRMSDYFAVNVLGVENIVEAAGGRRVLLASSSEVYGLVPEEEQPIPESRRPAPANPYALTKAVAERLVLASGGLVVRLFNLVGPGQSPSFALPGFADQLAAQRGERSASLAVGNLGARRDFVHVADAADAIKILAGSDAHGEVFNIAGGEAVSIEQALGELVEIAGLDVTLEVDPERMRPIDVPLVCGDSTKLESLGWKTRRGRRQALRDLWKTTCAGERQSPA